MSQKIVPLARLKSTISFGYSLGNCFFIPDTKFMKIKGRKTFLSSVYFKEMIQPEAT